MAASLFFVSAKAQSPSPENIVINNKEHINDFCLFSQNEISDILVDTNDINTVKLVAELFRDDLERVSGKKPILKRDIKSSSEN